MGGTRGLDQLSKATRNRAKATRNRVAQAESQNSYPNQEMDLNYV